MKEIEAQMVKGLREQGHHQERGKRYHLPSYSN